jgi:uncharacterized membrane protein
MNKNSIILFIILIFCWTLNPFFKKHAMGVLDANQYVILNIILCFLFFMIYWAYLYMNKFNMDNIYNITKKQLIYCILAALTSVFATLVFIKLLENDNVTFIIPQSYPIIIILTLIIGYLLFNETLSNKKMVGGIIVVIGYLIIHFFNF